MAERKVWSEQEDQILKALVQVRKITKWSQIAKIFCSEFGISHRNGKQCRQRYLNHLASGLKKGEWTQEEEQKLIKLHNRYGNRWAQISRHFEGRTDNCVKNQLYSRLRKSMKYINDTIEKSLRKKFKLLKVNFIYKLIQMSDQKYKSLPAIKKQAFEQSYQLKNKILKMQSLQENYNEENIISLICQINKFNKKYKKRIVKKKSHKDLYSSQGQQEDIGQSFQNQIQQKNKCHSKKILAETEVQIKISPPSVDSKEEMRENTQNQANDKKGGFRVLKKDSIDSCASNRMGRLHSLSIQKESVFQTLINSLQTEGKLQELGQSNSLFSRVDPLVHGQANQSKLKTRRSQSIESIPNIMVDIGSTGDIKNNQFKTSRLRSFGSIEESFEFQNDRTQKISALEKQLMNKDETQYWLSNVR